MSLLALALMAWLVPHRAFAGEMCRVVRVADGDTITCLTSGNRQVKIRLYGIDCPEKKQSYGQRATQALASLIAGQMIEYENLGHDRYGRVIGLISHAGHNVNLEMIRQGYAWVYTRYCKKAFCSRWKQAENSARRHRLGLWQDNNAVPPWEWRKIRRGR